MPPQKMMSEPLTLNGFADCNPGDAMRIRLRRITTGVDAPLPVAGTIVFIALNYTAH